MKKTRLPSIIALNLLFAFSFAYPVSAHGEQPRLELSVDRVSPGGTVDLRGVNFEPGSQVWLSLTGSVGEVPLGEVTADMEGTFVQTITVPPDLAEGTYAFHASTYDHDIFSASMIVSGSPILDEQGGEQRGEEEPLLAPMPTYPPAPVQSAALTAGAASTSSQLDLSWPALIVAVLMAIGMILFFSRGAKRRH